MQPTLPNPDSDSAAHAQQVADHLRGIIGTGSISFARFMQEALYAPGLGYYAAGSAKFGPAGDFVTAPEVSPVFGRIVARQCAEVIAGIEDADVLEFGAGSGRLAADVLSALAKLEQLPRRYYILEVSPDLRERQQRLLASELADLVDRVEWLSELPQGFRGVVIANEVLDAMPVERFVKREGEVVRLAVATDGNEFNWVEAEAPQSLRAAVGGVEADIGYELADGYKSEINLAGPAWISDIAQTVELGAILLFDYGLPRREYYAPERSDGWLRCHFRHHAHNDPLILTGIQDLTAWVDFSAIAAAAVESGLDILGYQPQASFLLGGGLDEEMRGFANLSMPEQAQLSGQIKTLTLPGEMGENFKCIALGRGDVAVPSAFQFADRTQTL